LTLEQYIFPSIGQIDARTLRTSQLLNPIKAVDTAGKHDVAQRLMQRVTAIMRFGVQNDLLESNPACDMAGALLSVKATHHPALPPKRIPELLERLSRYKG
ncbi:tyrosine-type recombinase/integrase, partial [Escherichia coli]